MVPTKRRTAGAEQARWRVLDLYAGGHSLRVISHITGWGKPAITRLLRSQGIRVDESRIDRPIRLEEENMTQQKSPTRADFEEMREETTRLRNITIETAIREADERGEIHRRAKERNIDYGNALVEFVEEIEEPFKRVERNAEEKRLEREFGPRTPVVTLEDEARACGVNPSEVRGHAKRHGLDPLDALIALAEERAPEPRAEEPSVVNLDQESEEERINREAEARARREGCSFEIALEAVLQEEVA